MLFLCYVNHWLDQKITIMSVNPITKVIPRQNAALDNFLHHCHTKKYATRSTIIHAGDDSETLYYIIEGSVSVVIEDEDCNEIVLAYLNPGDFFGEMGLFEEDIKRSAWVITRTACEVAEIHYHQFMQLAKETPEILFQLSSGCHRAGCTYPARPGPRAGRDYPSRWHANQDYAPGNCKDCRLFA